MSGIKSTFGRKLSVVVVTIATLALAACTGSGGDTTTASSQTPSVEALPASPSDPYFYDRVCGFGGLDSDLNLIVYGQVVSEFLVPPNGGMVSPKGIYLLHYKVVNGKKVTTTASLASPSETNLFEEDGCPSTTPTN